jgi:hypothetical protein
MKTCVSCVHWDPYYGQAPELRRLSVHRKVWTLGACDHVALPDDFDTPANFGCTLHEPIGPVCPSCGREGLHDEDCDDCARHRA